MSLAIGKPVEAGAEAVSVSAVSEAEWGPREI
jgi:hypothetical protein